MPAGLPSEEEDQDLGLDEQRMRILLLRCGEAHIIPLLFKELPWESQGGALKRAHPGSDSGDS